MTNGSCSFGCILSVEAQTQRSLGFLTLPHPYLMSPIMIKTELLISCTGPTLTTRSPSQGMELPTPRLFQLKVEGSFLISLFPLTPTFSPMTSLNESMSKTYSKHAYLLLLLQSPPYLMPPSFSTCCPSPLWQPMWYSKNTNQIEKLLFLKPLHDFPLHWKSNPGLSGLTGSYMKLAPVYL